MNERYRGVSGFSSGNSNYEDPDDKEAPIWKILLLVIGVIAAAFGVMVGGFFLLTMAFG